MKIGIESNILKHLLQNVYFINGTAYAGKSTMIKRLSEEFDGIWCGENYHDELMDCIDEIHQPSLSYLRNMKDWQEFISRTPEEYDNWVQGCYEESIGLELIILLRLVTSGKKIFVDTCIPPSVLKEISDEKHVLIMLAPRDTSVKQFFEREDAEKQFLYQQLLQAKEPEKAIQNFRSCLERVNSQEHFDEYLNSGFEVLHRDENRTIDETLEIVAKHFGLL